MHLVVPPESMLVIQINGRLHLFTHDKPYQFPLVVSTPHSAMKMATIQKANDGAFIQFERDWNCNVTEVHEMIPTLLFNCVNADNVRGHVNVELLSANTAFIV